MPTFPARHAVRITRDALRQIRGGHPWVYDGSLTRSPALDDTAAGDLAVVFDDKRRFAAIGLWDPGSPLRIRILHVGAPTTIDGEFLRRRIEAAIERRARLVDPERPEGATTGWRVIHGENDELPGFVVDRYDTVLVVRLDTAAWSPHLGAMIDLVTAALAERDLGTDGVVVRSSRVVGLEPFVERGSVPDGPVAFAENGLTFTADVRHGQKTGHFLDQRDNRALVRTLAQGRSVLDVFSCTGGFSVHAAAGGARSLTAVDLSRPALEAVGRHLDRNDLDVPLTTIDGDAFEVMARLVADGRRFGLVIVDPPSFASKAADRERALRAYGRLATLGAELVEPGGLLLQASCSSRITGDELEAVVASGVAEADRRGRIEHRSAHAVDHPVGFEHGAYLDAVLLRLD